jgi:hypothetical protein
MAGLVHTVRESFNPDAPREVHGVMAEFDTPEAILKAGSMLRTRFGYTKMDAFTPFPVHGMENALGIPRSILGYIVICVGLSGTTTAVLMQWWTGAIAYPLVIAGKPLFSVEFAMPVMFELSVLFSAFCCVFGMLGLNRLPRLNHPVFSYSRFHKSSDDGFLLLVERDDPKFEANETKKLLESLGARNVEVVED